MFRNSHFDYRLTVISALWVKFVNEDVLIILLWIIFLVCTAVSNYMIIAYKANNGNHVVVFSPCMGERGTLYDNLKRGSFSARACKAEGDYRLSSPWGNSCRNVPSGMMLILNNGGCLKVPFIKQIFQWTMGQHQKHSINRVSTQTCVSSFYWPMACKSGVPKSLVMLCKEVNRAPHPCFQ